jgi:hypothetical protein
MNNNRRNSGLSRSMTSLNSLPPPYWPRQLTTGDRIIYRENKNLNNFNLPSNSFMWTRPNNNTPANNNNNKYFYGNFESEYKSNGTLPNSKLPSNKVLKLNAYKIKEKKLMGQKNNIETKLTKIRQRIINLSNK